MDENAFPSSVDVGAKIISRYAKTLPDTPGVYRMLDEKGGALYVGKARSLKKRVISYTRPARLSIRIQRMISLTRKMEFVHTETEAEALLLESNLIKKLKPRYNILLRDDKSFPYILLTGDHDFPLVTKHRGAKKRKGQYYGPFASTGDVNRTIDILQRVFLLRNCSDNVFANRTRPCLQYHVKRCTAPCVDKVTQEEYAEQVDQARDFLDGKNRAVQERMADLMQRASAMMDYEAAAQYRDRIKALTAVQATQGINMEGIGNADVIALVQDKGRTCVQVFFFRAGRNYGNRAYFLRHHDDDGLDDILSAFVSQFYENKPVPKEIITSHNLTDHEVLMEALSSRTPYKVTAARPSRGKRKKLVEFALRNAQAALARHISARQSDEKMLQEVAGVFGLDDPPSRIEVYDNSHISGTNMVGAMIVAGPDGFCKNAYRKFNIRDAGEADDYGMMREVLSRRFKKALGGGADIGGEDWPDLLLIDGGQGQFNAAREVLEEYGISESVALVAIAKGADRHAGRETFFMEGRRDFRIPERSPVLHYLQTLRDEAHRFAVGAHRGRRKKEMTGNPLDEIPGIGPKRRRALLIHFGSSKAVARAGVDDLSKVSGISKAMAEAIYAHFH